MWDSGRRGSWPLVSSTYLGLLLKNVALIVEKVCKLSHV